MSANGRLHAQTIADAVAARQVLKTEIKSESRVGQPVI